MSYSPISDPGYASSVSSPTLTDTTTSSPKRKAAEVSIPIDNSYSLQTSPVSETVRLRAVETTAASGPEHGQYTNIGHRPHGLAFEMPTVLSKPKRASFLITSRIACYKSSASAWLAIYFLFNLSLTLYNKYALASFPYPWMLTCIHSLCAAVGSYSCLQRGYFEQSGPLNSGEALILLAFSSLYTINIAVSNLSLNAVSVPMHQVVRSTTPIFTIIISACLLSKRYALQTYVSLIPVVLGVCLATYGDYTFTTGGLLLTLSGAGLAAIKGLATNRILVGRLKMHPLDLLLRMSPLAFGQCLLFAWKSGELAAVHERIFVDGTLGRSDVVSLAINGAIAFGLNVVSFTANKKTGALTMSVAANVKQVLTIVLAVILFNLKITTINLLGIALTISGGAYYTYVEYQTKKHGINADGRGALPTLMEALPVVLDKFYVSPSPKSLDRQSKRLSDEMHGAPGRPTLSDDPYQQRQRVPSATSTTFTPGGNASRRATSISNWRYPRSPSLTDMQ